MYLRRYLLCALAALALCACATSADRVVGRAEMERDARRVERVLRRGHPAVGRTVAATDLTATLERIVAELPDSATVLEFARRVHPLVDTLRGGHVGLYPRGAALRALGAGTDGTFPLAPKRLTDGRVIVAGVAPGLDSALVGEEIVAIDGAPVEDLVAEAGLFGGGSDGPNTTGVDERAARRLPTYLAWRDGARDSFHVELRSGAPASESRGGDRADTSYALTLASFRRDDHPEAAARQKARRKSWRPLGYGFDSLRRVAVIDVNSFDGYDPLNLRWPVALRRLFARARRDGAEGLVLDLRGNGGGRSANVATLLRQVVTEPTQIYEPWLLPRGGWAVASPVNKASLAPSAVLGRGPTARFGRWMRHRVQPRPGGFAGPIAVLVDGGTFSAAAAVAAVLKSSGRATVIGQEAGGNYHETYAGLFTTVPLRATGLQLRLPHLLIPVAVDATRQPTDLTLQPDIAWPVTREAVLAGRDEVLLRALLLVGGT